MSWRLSEALRRHGPTALVLVSLAFVVGLVVTSDWLIDVTADLVGHHAVGPGDDALRPKDWLHLSLAYGVDDLRSHAARAGSFDAGAAGGWELGLYERRHDGSWSRLR